MMDVSFESIKVQLDGAILRVTLDNPRNVLNAVDAGMHADLVALFAALKEETSARAIFLTGSGRAFSAGGDLDWMQAITAADYPRMLAEGKQLIWNLLDVQIPIVAAVNGPAIGLGATLALFCDGVFMSTAAKLADPHVRVGLVAGDGGAIVWPLAVGPLIAKRYLLTGDAIDAADAERLGLITRAVAPEDLEKEALGFASRLASGAPLAIGYTKLAVNQLIKQAAATAFDYSTALETLTFASADHAEALTALREKRDAVFEGC
jgi:enoyl-CoA hydratase